MYSELSILFWLKCRIRIIEKRHLIIVKKTMFWINQECPAD